MANPWELEWQEFEMPDGLRASYAIDGRDVKMMVDEEDLPDGMDIEQRMAQCYDYFFTYLYQK